VPRCTPQRPGQRPGPSPLGDPAVSSSLAPTPYGLAALSNDCRHAGPATSGVRPSTSRSRHSRSRTPDGNRTPGVPRLRPMQRPPPAARSGEELVRSTAARVQESRTGRSMSCPQVGGGGPGRGQQPLATDDVAGESKPSASIHDVAVPSRSCDRRPPSRRRIPRWVGVGAVSPAQVWRAPCHRRRPRCGRWLICCFEDDPKRIDGLLLTA